MNKSIKPIKKVIILAAGWGTRFLPLTKTIHKELVPVLNKPLIHYLATEALEAGIEEIIFVISPRKKDIVKYFTLNLPLEKELKKKGKHELLKKVLATNQMANVSVVIQKKQLGIGHAIAMAASVIKDEPFAVILGDDLISSSVPAIKQLVEAYNQVGASIVGVQTVGQEMIQKYGIVDPLDGDEKDYKMFKIKGAVEKPHHTKAPSNKALLGRYVFTPEIMNILLAIIPNWKASQGEINVIDAFKQLLLKEFIYAFEFEGERYDLGSIEGFVKANIDLAIKHPEISAAIKKHIKKRKLC